MTDERDPHLDPVAVVSAAPCPRCGCHITHHFECFCGEVHSDYCDNCGRFTSLGPTEYTKLGDFDERCTHGTAPHAHDAQERCARVDRAMAWYKRYIELFRWRTALSQLRGDELISLLMRMSDPLGGDPALPQLPRELENVWTHFGALPRDEREAIARAWVGARE